jgi:two-component system, LuxR family, response regulator FixJ
MESDKSSLVAPRIVLVVEDDAALRNSLKFAFELEGYAVHTYASGSAILQDAGPPEPYCLVIDYRLPDMDGLELLQRLRARGIDAPAILITTGPSSSVRGAARRAGVHIIEKPLLGNALSEAIRNAFASNATE